MRIKKTVKNLLSDPEGRKVLGFLLILYYLYFASAVVLVVGVNRNILEGDFDISEGKAILFALFVGQIIYGITNHESLTKLLNNKDFLDLVGKTLLIAGAILVAYLFYKGVVLYQETYI